MELTFADNSQTLQQRKHEVAFKDHTTPYKHVMYKPAPKGRDLRVGVPTWFMLSFAHEIFRLKSLALEKGMKKSQLQLRWGPSGGQLVGL